MEKLTPEEKAKGRANVMKAAASAIKDGKLDEELLRENIRAMLRANSKKETLPKFLKDSIS
jgi:hypothetical protein